MVCRHFILANESDSSVKDFNIIFDILEILNVEDVSIFDLTIDDCFGEYSMSDDEIELYLEEENHDAIRFCVKRMRRLKKVVLALYPPLRWRNLERRGWGIFEYAKRVGIKI